MSQGNNASGSFSQPGKAWRRVSRAPDIHRQSTFIIINNQAMTSLEPLPGGFNLAAAKTGDASMDTEFGEAMNIATTDCDFW